MKRLDLTLLIVLRRSWKTGEYGLFQVILICWRIDPNSYIYPSLIHSTMPMTVDITLLETVYLKALKLPCSGIF